MAILATRSGWLIAGNIVKETNTFYCFERVDKKGSIMKARKDGTGNYRIFESTDEALDWIGGE